MWEEQTIQAEQTASQERTGVGGGIWRVGEEKMRLETASVELSSPFVFVLRLIRANQNV